MVDANKSLTGVLIRRGNMDTQRDNSSTCVQRDNHVKRQQEGGHLQAKGRDLRRNKT